MLWVLNRSASMSFNEALLMSTHNICLYGELEKITQNYHQILLLNKSSGVNIFLVSTMKTYIVDNH